MSSLRHVEGVCTFLRVSSRIAPIAGGTNVELLEKIVSDQRSILKDVFKTTDLSTIPQVWTLCESLTA